MSADLRAYTALPGTRPLRIVERRSVRLRRSLRSAAPALALYATVRLCGLLLLVRWARSEGRHPYLLLARSWDSVWYARIADHGYGHVLRFDAARTFSDEAFFPLYPGLVRAVSAVLPGGFAPAGLLVSWSASGLAAWGIYGLGERLHGRRTGVLLALLWGVLPHAVVESMAYTEGLLTACAAWALFAVLTERWLCAGFLAVLAGLARPNGVAVAAAVSLAALLALWRAAGAPRSPYREYGRESRCRRAGGRDAPIWRVWAGGAVAPLGWLGYILAVGVRHRDPIGGYFAVQRAWGSEFDFGRNALTITRNVALGRERFTYAVVIAVVAVSLLLCVLLLLDRSPLPLVVYTAVLVLIAVGNAHFFLSKPRFLLPAFPLLLPVAAAMARARLRTVLVTVGALAGLSWCYGAFLLTFADSPP